MTNFAPPHKLGPRPFRVEDFVLLRPACSPKQEEDHVAGRRAMALRAAAGAKSGTD